MSLGHWPALLVRFALCYLFSSIVLTALLFDVLGLGHADVPFTEFPSYLVLAPLAPTIPCVLLFTDTWTSGAIGLLVFGVTFFALWKLHGNFSQRRQQ